MPGEKLTRILKAKSPFSREEIAAMSEVAGWDWVYANAKPKKEKLSQVCFTGFSATEKAALTTAAAEARLEVVGTKALGVPLRRRECRPGKTAEGTRAGHSHSHPRRFRTPIGKR